MNLKPFYPAHPLLKDLVEYYYFQQTDSEEFRAEYFAFPNTLIPLNIHKNISCTTNGNEVKITGINQPNYVIVLNVLHNLPLHVQLQGKIDKVTILFKPLGLNHFIQQPLHGIVQKPADIFTDWEDLPGTTPFLDSFYLEQQHEKRISILEEYLVSIYKPFPEYRILKDILKSLNDFNTEISIEEIARTHSLSSRTLNRIFKHHTGIAPVTFRKIARFRHSLTNKVLKAEFERLTSIAYDSNFYDQSYFIKVYKQFTGQNPKAFFNSIDKLAGGKLIFRFVR